MISFQLQHALGGSAQDDAPQDHTIAINVRLIVRATSTNDGLSHTISSQKRVTSFAANHGQTTFSSAKSRGKRQVQSPQEVDGYCLKRGHQHIRARDITSPIASPHRRMVRWWYGLALDKDTCTTGLIGTVTRAAHTMNIPCAAPSNPPIRLHVITVVSPLVLMRAEGVRPRISHDQSLISSIVSKSRKTLSRMRASLGNK